VTTLGIVLLALVAYTYVGYPLLIATIARLFARPLRDRPGYEPRVSVCMTVHDGARDLPRKLESLLALDYPREALEILICSDGSTDDSVEIVRRFAECDPRISLFESSTRRGKPASLNRLLREATGEVLLLTDVRQPLSKNAVRALVAPLSDPTVGCVSGNLVLSGFSGAGVYWRYERFIRDSEGKLGSMVGVSGAVYALRRADLTELPADVILDDMFVPLRIELTGKKVVFTSEAQAYDDAFDDEREFGRKVRTLAGNYQLVAKMPRLLLPSSRVWLPLVSHKLLRLVCPWALVALLLVSVVIAVSPPPDVGGSELLVWRALAVGQLALYALAALGAAAGRLGSVARTFVVLNAAAVAGLWRFARGTQAVTW
jgi:biofilm PGA synthesis N-glycosyltransferase PgaC